LKTNLLKPANLTGLRIYTNGRRNYTRIKKINEPLITINDTLCQIGIVQIGIVLIILVFVSC